MDKKRKEELIDLLLVDINDYVETTGRPIDSAYFNITEDSIREFLDENKIYFKDIEVLLKICCTRSYIQPHSNSIYEYLKLTDIGQARAISIEAAKNNPKKIVSGGSTINIDVLNSHGSTQIGDNNIQNIESALEEIIKLINESSSTKEEKTEAKKRLQHFLAHPLTNTAIGLGGNALTALITSLGG